MAPKFGTSGLRGLVVELTDTLVADHIRAFLSVCGEKTLFIGRDLRPSSPDIAAVVARTARDFGVDVVDCGAVPTPALALASLGKGAAVMVTGSHIPFDRNGIKFYRATGEISKQDEAAIVDDRHDAEIGNAAERLLLCGAVAASPILARERLADLVAHP